MSARFVSRGYGSINAMLTTEARAEASKRDFGRGGKRWPQGLVVAAIVFSGGCTRVAPTDDRARDQAPSPAVGTGAGACVSSVESVEVLVRQYLAADRTLSAQSMTQIERSISRQLRSQCEHFGARAPAVIACWQAAKTWAQAEACTAPPEKTPERARYEFARELSRLFGETLGNSLRSDSTGPMYRTLRVHHIDCDAATLRRFDPVLDKLRERGFVRLECDNGNRVVATMELR